MINGGLQNYRLYVSKNSNSKMKTVDWMMN